MSGIAAPLGGLKASFYRYFPLREALFEAAKVQCAKNLCRALDG
ncbi:TetR family transcriptional regulator [Rhizobium wenxiniae]|nr:TetR family transcriptional regulator [Rhizobium wenxiniae]